MTVIVFMVAGMSSRFGGKTKQLTIVGPNEETLIEYSVNQAILNNFSKIVFITNVRTEKSFVDIFGQEYKGLPVLYCRQSYDPQKRKRPWGTTDAVCCLYGKIQEPFILVNGDDIYGSSTFRKGFYLLNASKSNICGGCALIDSLPMLGTVNRGIIKKNGPDVESIVEMFNIDRKNKELHRELASVNFIGLQYHVVEMLKELLDKFKEKNDGNEKIECLLPETLTELIKTKTIKMKHFKINNKIIGITNPGDETIVRELLNKE